MIWPIGLRYHQKAALLHNIIPYIHEVKATSLLDIGAGSIEMALPLSRQVHQYCAIERDLAHVSELRRAGLDVIHGTFPVLVQATYDFVLSSHSVPEDSIESYSHFLSAAWNCTSLTGMMLIVTFKGSLGALADLRRDLLGSAANTSPEIALIVEHCTNFGVTSVRCVNSYIEARTAHDIAQFLGPWLSRHQHIRDTFRNQLIQILEAQYRVREDLYVFPTQHLFISCRR